MLEEVRVRGAPATTAQSVGIREFAAGLGRGLRKLGPKGLSGLALVLLFFAMALLGGRLAPYDPLEVDVTRKLAAPGPSLYLGTDELGRDILSRIMAGARLSAFSAVTVLSIGIGVGALAGAASGYFGGLVDDVVMRFTDVFLAFPALLLAMIVSAALGPSLLHAAIAIGAAWWPGYARLVRAEFLSLRTREFVDAARSLGARDSRIISRHIFPNAVPPIIVKATMDCGYAILMSASLSFVGLGAQPPTPEWGEMVTAGRDYLLGYWWYSTFPGLAIFLVVLGFTELGDALRDVIDPARGNLGA